MNIKDGIKTSEFWGKLIIQAVALVGMLKGVLPAEQALVIVSVLEGIYTAFRGLVKIFAKKDLPPLNTPA